MLQQPLGHDCALHCGCCMHTLLEHDWPMAAQFWQAWPPLPHAVWEVPAMHRPFEQQPFGHVAALQGGATHAWPRHTLP